MPDYRVKNIEPIAMSADIRVRLFTLAYRNLVPWHYHSANTDHYFVLRGRLDIETRSPDERRVLKAGERYQVPPQIPHRISNSSISDCQFLLVQGVGKYDWHSAETSIDALRTENLALREQVADLAIGIRILRDQLRDGGKR
jgi:quercetin dioxygenase-like cupin family protein